MTWSAIDQIGVESSSPDLATGLNGVGGCSRGIVVTGRDFTQPWSVGANCGKIRMARVTP